MIFTSLFQRSSDISPKMKNPIVTVVVPCHGSLPYLKETVDSLIHQTFSDFEVIIVNDLIAEKHLKYVHGLSRIDSRFKVVDSHGHGISSALNTGIELSKSNFIARIDSDDIMDPKRLEFQLDRISMSMDILCVGTQLRMIDELGKLIRYTRFPESSNQIREVMKIRNIVAHPSVMVRKDAVLMAGSYRSFFDGTEDYDLWLRLMKFGEIVNIHEPLTSYRVHVGQETRKNREYQQEMDSITRLYALDQSLNLNPPNGSSLRSAVRSGNLKFNELLKVSTLPNQTRISLLSSHNLNVAMSNPKFTNLLRALCILTIRPKMFYSALKYSLSRWINFYG